MEEKIRVIFKAPGQNQKQIELEDSFESLQNAVGGYIECIRPIKTDFNIVLICNEEGKLLDLEPNLFISNNDIVVGNCLFAGTDGEEIISLNFEQIKKIQNFIFENKLFINSNNQKEKKC